jgi:hypothetical protein
MFTIYLICFLTGVGFSALSLLTMFAQGLHHAGGHQVHTGHHGHSTAHAAGARAHLAPAHGTAAGQHATAGHTQHASAAQGQSEVMKQAQTAVADAANVATPLLMRLNITAIVLFLAIFGGVGLLLSPSHQLVAPLIGAIAGACGLAGSMAVNRVLRAIVSRERPLEPVEYTGTLAQVTVPIRNGGGTGEIVYTLDGARCCSGARSDDGTGIARGAEVVIVRYDKGIAYVAAFEDAAAQPPVTISLTNH